MTRVGDTWYRFEEACYATFPEESPFSALPDVRLTLMTYRVITVTPKGVRLAASRHCSTWGPDTNVRKGKLVLHSWTRKFACPTVEGAKTSFLARKNVQIRILQRRLSIAKMAFDLMLEDDYRS